MSFEPRDFLLHVLVEAEYLLNQSRKIDIDSFKSNESLRRAFVRSLEIIGEASKRVPREFQAEHPKVDWRGMAGMRDRLIHGYFAVDYDLVWDVVQKEIATPRQLRDAIVPHVVAVELANSDNTLLAPS